MLPVQLLSLCKIPFFHRVVGLLNFGPGQVTNLKSVTKKPCSTNQTENSNKNHPAFDDLRPHNNIQPQQVFSDRLTPSPIKQPVPKPKPGRWTGHVQRESKTGRFLLTTNQPKP